jgi:hypothetical protein
MLFLVLFSVLSLKFFWIDFLMLIFLQIKKKQQKTLSKKKRKLSPKKETKKEHNLFVKVNNEFKRIKFVISKKDKEISYYI